jgi:hypothetical protein
MRQSQVSVWMVKQLLCLFLVLSAPAIISAKTFTNNEFGYSIEIDDGYQLRRNDGASYFRSEQDGGHVVIRNWPGLDLETARSYLQEGYQDARLAVVPDGEVKEMAVGEGKGYLVNIKGIAERRPIRGVAGAFVGDKGQGMIVVFTGPEEDWDKLATAAESVAASVKFVESKSAPLSPDWYRMLAGTRLSFRGKVGDDRNVREYLNLCADGYFLHRISSSAVRDSESGSSIGHSRKTRSGVWRVVDEDETDRLMLQYNDGRDVSGVIESRDGKIYIDGRHYTRLRKNSCR